MSDTTATTTPTSSHISRRRHASQTAGPNWARRAGVAGGVIGTTLALTGMAPPADAGTAASPSNDPATTGSIPVIPGLSTSETSAQAIQALDQTAADYQLAALRTQAAAAAQKQAQRVKAAETARKAAAEKAANARAAVSGTASRSSERTVLPAASGSVAGVLGFLMAQVGKPYVYGATGPTAFDCSGLTKAAFATIGVDLPRTSQAQSTVGTAVPVSDVQPGDLLFWGGRGSAYHVAVYVGGGQYLDAANPSKGVVIQKMAYYMPTSAVRVA
jgi:cell wall-associated NlpC family hydrolase